MVFDRPLLAGSKLRASGLVQPYILVGPAARISDAAIAEPVKRGP